MLWTHVAVAGLSDNTLSGVRLSAALMLGHQCSTSNPSTYRLCPNAYAHSKPQPEMHSCNDTNSVAPISLHTPHTLHSIPPGKVKRWVIICSSQLCVTSLIGTQPQYKEIKHQRWPCVGQLFYHNGFDTVMWWCWFPCFLDLQNRLYSILCVWVITQGRKLKTETAWNFFYSL